MKTVTISDVAKYAEVSKSTVSQYLNKRYDYMAVKTKDKIEAAIKELGYQPNIVARSLKQKSTTTIGVIVANILHEFSTQVIRAIEDVCNELGFHIIVCNADDEPIKEKKYIEMLRAKQVDGIIVFPTGDNVELYERMVEDNYPIVFLDRRIPGVPVSSILLNNENAALLAVNEFTSKGYDRVGIITPPTFEAVTPRSERIEGYKDALKANNLSVETSYIKSLEINSIQAGLKEMLSLPEPPNAILAMNDLVLIEILKFVKENEKNIPEDFALIGIDDVSFASFYNPSLTTIAQPTFEMGKKAAEILLNKIKKTQTDDTEEVYRFEPMLIKRSSC
ncbi:LacI family DNA-binding transcriptional regulator [Virgibacillus flavescens]|uniref:LacI family DNA-binding transcriptional regulator n=1 Tax=Virgibacillus flavescens TaxID=1611422 RepID=UPI003D33295E